MRIVDNIENILREFCMIISHKDSKTRSRFGLFNYLNGLLKSLFGLWKRIIFHLNIIMEKFRGLDFIRVLHPSDLGLDEKIVHRGSPSGDRFLSNVLKKLEIKSIDSILDIGCSKGSAIRVMHNFPFRRIDGLEISDVLCQIAESNFKKLNFKSIRVFNIDAQDFKNYKSYNYFYFYNPFPEIVMARVISCLKYQIGNQKAIIIYNNPVCHKVIIEFGFHKIREFRDRWGNGIYIYSN